MRIVLTFERKHLLLDACLQSWKDMIILFEINWINGDSWMTAWLIVCSMTPLLDTVRPKSSHKWHIHPALPSLITQTNNKNLWAKYRRSLYRHGNHNFACERHLSNNQNTHKKVLAEPKTLQFPRISHIYTARNKNEWPTYSRWQQRTRSTIEDGALRMFVYSLQGIWSAWRSV